jgi:hypothetical protein
MPLPLSTRPEESGTPSSSPADCLQRLLHEMQGLCALMPGQDGERAPEQRGTGLRHNA